MFQTSAIGFYYGSAQEFITEGVNAPATADLTGDGRTEIATAPGIFSPTELYNPDATRRATYGPSPLPSFLGVIGSPAAIQAALQGNLPEDVPPKFPNAPEVVKLTAWHGSWRPRRQ